jgi:hypothetical protein
MLTCADRTFHGPHFWLSPKHRFWCDGTPEYLNLKATVETNFKAILDNFLAKEDTATDVWLYLKEVGLGKLENIFIDVLSAAKDVLSDG